MADYDGESIVRTEGNVLAIVLPDYEQHGLRKYHIRISN